MVQPTLVSTISSTSGAWGGNLNHISTDVNNTVYVYRSGSIGDSSGDIQYNWTTKKWSDIVVTDNFFTFGTQSSNTTDRETSVNPQTVYLWRSDQSLSNGLKVVFTNPYYSTGQSGTGGTSTEEVATPATPSLYWMKFESFVTSYGRSVSIHYKVFGNYGDVHRIEQWRDGTLIHASSDAAFAQSALTGRIHWWNYPNAETGYSISDAPQTGDEFRMVFTLSSGYSYVVRTLKYRSKVFCNFW